jgi:hypothetical protein
MSYFRLAKEFEFLTIGVNQLTKIPALFSDTNQPCLSLPFKNLLSSFLDGGQRLTASTYLAVK